MSDLTKEQILAASDVQVDRVDVPAWGGSVYVRTMTGKESDRLYQSIIDPKTHKVSIELMEGYKARQAVVFLSDAQGNRLFTDDEADAVSGKLHLVLETICEAGRRVNKMDEDDVDGLEKNSEPTTSAGGGSD